MKDPKTPSQFAAYCQHDKRSEVFEELERQPLNPEADSVYAACTWCGTESVFARSKDASRYPQSEDDSTFGVLKESLTVGNPSKYYRWKKGEADE